MRPEHRQADVALPASPRVRACAVAGMLVEHYVYGAGRVEPVPGHAHVAYQVGLSFDCAGDYFYRGAWQRVAPGSVSLIQSGEPHAPSERRALPAPATFRMLYLEPAVLHELRDDVPPGGSTVPVFPELSTADPVLAGCVLALHQAVLAPATPLERDQRRLALVSRLVLSHTQDRPAQPRLATDRPALMRVRDVLTEQHDVNISLHALAQLAGLSPYHLCRSFRAVFGLSPHAYHLQVRIDRAKQLLARGVPLGETAHRTGFADQSHFGRHFRRHVGTSPGRYAVQRKNVPDT